MPLQVVTHGIWQEGLRYLRLEGTARADDWPSLYFMAYITFSVESGLYRMWGFSHQREGPLYAEGTCEDHRLVLDGEPTGSFLGPGRLRMVFEAVPPDQNRMVTEVEGENGAWRTAFEYLVEPAE